MPPHPLNNFKTKNYFYDVYVVNIDEYKKIVIHWIAL